MLPMAGYEGSRDEPLRPDPVPEGVAQENPRQPPPSNGTREGDKIISNQIAKKIDLFYYCSMSPKNIAGFHHRQTIIYWALAVLCLSASVAGYRVVQNKHVLYRQAENAWKSGDDRRALPLYEKAILAGADFPDAYINAGEIALAQGEIERGATLLDTLAFGGQDIAPGLAGRIAGLYDQYGEPGRALNVLEHSHVKIKLQEPQLLHMADLLRRDFAYGKALDVYRDVLAENPESRPAGLGLAETLGWLGRFEEALPLCQNLLSAHPGDRNARVLYARILSWNGQFDDAIREYKLLLGEEQ